jgi:hypothetical protein
VGLKAVGIVLGNRKVARGKQPTIIQQEVQGKRDFGIVEKSIPIDDLCRYLQTSGLMVFLPRMKSMT